MSIFGRRRDRGTPPVGNDSGQLTAFRTAPNLEEAIADLQADTGSYIHTVPISEAERRDILRQARRDGRSGVAGVKADGLAWGPYITERRCLCAQDVSLNIQAFYTRTLPYVIKILSLARALKKEEECEKGAGAADAPRSVNAFDATWERQRRRAERDRERERARQLDAMRIELTGYLAAYRTALLELERAGESCRSAYLERAIAYTNEVLRSRLRGGIFRQRTVRTPDAFKMQEHIKFPPVEVSMPEDVFADKGPADVVRDADRLKMPAAYLRLKANALFAAAAQSTVRFEHPVQEGVDDEKQA